MLPFDLPPITRGRAELTRSAAERGAAAAEAAAAAVGRLLGGDARFAGRPLHGHGGSADACARLSFDLPALPGTAVIEIDAAFVTRLVDRMAGGAGEVPGATRLTPVEASALELLALAALEGLAAVDDVERALSPRLARGCAEPASPLAVALELEVLGERGRGRLLVPPAAVRALRGPPDVPPGLERLAVTASLRRGAAAVGPEDLEALAIGDVLLLDSEAAPRESLVLPGGFRLAGRLEEGTFHLEEMSMTEIAASMPLTLEVELARLSLTLGELARLEPGAALPLPIDRRGLVAVRAGDRLVARGELVEIDGAVGVRILELEGRP